MNLPQLATKRPVATIMVFLTITLLGVISLSRLSVDLLPNLSYPVFAIRTTCPNMAPEEVENTVTRPIEEAVAGLPWIRQLYSSSIDGLSLVTLEYAWGTKMNFAALNVREKLDQIRQLLPDNSGRPTIVELDPSAEPIIVLAVSGSDMYQTKQFVEDVLKRRLEQISGVALASVTGGLEREIHIDIDEKAFAAIDVQLYDVVQALQQSNYSFPGGTIRKGRYRYALRTLGEFTSLQDIESVIVRYNPNGSNIKLSQIATVQDGYKQRTGLNRLNGEEAIGLLLIKETGSNTVFVSDRVQETLREIRFVHPDIKISEIYNQAHFISLAINNVVQSILYGSILAILVLFFFLRDIRLPLVIAASIPISILTAFLLFYKYNVQLNIMSLGGLALGIGLLVDNSIVVLENVFRLRENHVDVYNAATQGAAEVAMPLLASTLTTVVVFLPIIYVRGVAGQLFRDQACAVTFSLLASLPTALTLAPVLLLRILKEKKASLRMQVQQNSPKQRLVYFARHYFLRLQEKFKNLFCRFNPFLMQIKNKSQIVFSVYERLLEKALDKPKRTLVLSGVFFLSSFFAFFALHKELMPTVESDELIIDLTLAPGASLEWVSEVSKELEDRLLADAAVATVFAQVGQTRYGIEQASDIGLESSRLRVSFAKKSNPYNTLHRLRQEWQMPPGCDLTFHAAENIINKLFHVGHGDLEIAVYGSDLMILQELQNQVREQAGAIRGITDIWTTTTEGAPEVRILIDRHRAGRYGISIQHIIETIQHNVQGIVATQFNEFDRKTDILLRPTSEFDVTWDDLLKTRISIDSSQVPLSTFIDYNIGQGPIRINRQSQARRLTLYANVDGRSLEKVIDELQRCCANINVAPGYGINIGGVNEEMKQSFRELFLALLLAIVLVYMILAAQFESLRHPFLIILSIPMGLGGVIWALLLTGTGFNVLSFIGTVALAGIAVNDAIVKISFINQRRAEGLELRAAIIDAGRTRFRPIIMTSITTIFGLLPMALSHAPGGFLGRPLAVAIIGGLFSSTLLTLIVVPAFYFLMESNKRLS